MKKKTAILLLTFIVGLLFIPAAGAASIVKVDVYRNGEKLRTNDTPRIINDTTYVPLRAVCELFGADSISWDEKTKTAHIRARGIDIYATMGNTYIVANGRYFASNEPIKNIGDRLYLPVRLIASAFASDVVWHESDYSVRISDYGGIPASGDSHYNATDLYWMSRIIHAESRGEPLMGKIAVGNVVLNRAAHRDYPSTVKDVIFDTKYAVQFTPVASGTIYNTPSEESVIAAKIVLEGFTLSNKILFFMNPKIASSSWISNNRPFAFAIANHSFYY